MQCKHSENQNYLNFITFSDSHSILSIHSIKPNPYPLIPNTQNQHHHHFQIPSMQVHLTANPSVYGLGCIIPQLLMLYGKQDPPFLKNPLMVIVIAMTHLHLIPNLLPKVEPVSCTISLLILFFVSNIETLGIILEWGSLLRILMHLLEQLH